MPPTAKQRQDAGRQLGRDLDIENDTRRQSGLAPVTTERTPALNTGSIDAASLAAPVSRVNVPEPVQSIVQPPRGIDAVRDNLTFDIQEFRNNQAQERENFQLLTALGGGQSMQDQRTQLNDQFNISANQTRLQDIQTQLAGLSTQSLDTQVNIASEAGATGATSQRAMSAEKSKNNVRSYGLMAEASILQGNIESARAFVNDAMTTIYQDRQLERQNLIDQNIALSNILDPQRAEILMQDNRNYEEEIAATQRVQGAVDAAMQSGAATADDVKILTDPTLTDEDRLAAAQGIVSRGQTEMRNLDMEQQQASIDSSRASADNSRDSIRSRQLGDALAQAEIDQIANAGNNPDEVANTLANFANLRNVTQSVIDLSSGASPNPTAEFMRRNIGSSSTKNTQLEGFVNTLQVNMLTLATDPGIRKFFGPQMSDADVRLMTSAGTNLRPDEQTPEQLSAEALRIDDWINRAETAVREGSKGNNTSPNTITAPDGKLIEIID